MQVGPKLAFLRLPFHRSHHLVADDEAANVRATGFLDELLHEEVGIQPTKSLDDALGRLARFGKEGRPTIEQLAGAAGYGLVRSAGELETVKGDRVLAVFDTQPQEIDFPEVRLPVLTRWALERLSPDPEGFFLVVEQEGTDGASHANHTQKFIDSMISFDEAVGVALDFAAARNDVLLIVAADHECGGLQIHREKGTEMELVWATKSHTGEAVPVFAYGPGAEQFVGLMNGEDLGRKLIGLVR